MIEGTRAVWKPTRVTGSRKIDRMVARHNMEKAGYHRMNKKNRAVTVDMIGQSGGRGSKRSGSVFSTKWREYA